MEKTVNGLTFRKWMIQLKIYLKSRHLKTPEDFPGVHFESIWENGERPMAVAASLNK